MTDKELQRAHRWIVGGDTGMSSETIWSVMMGVPCRSPSTPLDPDDFGRCWRLLVLIPSWRPRMPEVAKKYPQWTAMVREWDRLSTMYEAVIADKDWPNQWTAAGKALYDSMQPLLDEGCIADGWTQDGPGCWSKGSKSAIEVR